MQKLEREFQPQLCMLRLKNHAAVKNQYVASLDLHALSPRMKQIARALTAPLLGAAEKTSDLLRILGEHDEDARIDRSLEAEW